MGFVQSKLAMSCLVLVSLWTLPAQSQIASQVRAAQNVRATALSNQEFHCHTGYPLAQCQQDILQLKRTLSRYPIEGLGHWTWVLVRSQDWRRISLTLRLNPISPAFSALEPRETFLEEALFTHDPERTSELMKEWLSSMPKLLELAVSHELGHAICAEPSETAADRFAGNLRNGVAPPCRIPKQKRRENVATEERQSFTPNVLRAP